MLARWVRFALIALIGIGILARLACLDNLPGVNGDETWYSIELFKLAAGMHPDLIGPTGRPMLNPFFLLPLAALQFLFDPHVWILRVPSVLFGILTVLLGFKLARPRLGALTALLVAAVLATSPILIAYARMGWDPSLLPFFALACLWCFVEAKDGWGVLFLIAGLGVHPTMVLLVPVVVCVWIDRFVRSNPSAGQRRIAWAALGATTVLGVLALLLLERWIPAAQRPYLDKSIHRMTDPVGFAAFLDGFAGLFGNSTILTFIVDDSYLAKSWNGRAVFLVLLAAASGLLLGLRKRHFGAVGLPLTGLVLGLWSSLLCLYVIFGPVAVRPQTERYGIFLVSPFLWMLVLACSPWLRRLEDPAGSPRPPVLTYAVVAAAILPNIINLSCFSMDYFGALLRTGGTAHQAFRTASTDPKLQAWQWVKDQHRQAVLPQQQPAGPSRIWAEGWWLAKPLEFFAIRDTDFTIQALHEDAATLPEVAIGDFLVVFYGSKVHDLVETKLRGRSAIKEVGTYGSPRFIVAYRVLR